MQVIRMPMDTKKHIKALFRETEVYSSQCLYVEAKEKCREVARLIWQSEQLKNKPKLMAAVAQKVRDLENSARNFEEAGVSARMSIKEEDIVKNWIFHSKGRETDSAALEGAIALLVLGQFEKALNEFNKLIEKDSYRVIAARNILRCHIGLGSLDEAVRQYHQWLSSGQFSLRHLEILHSFLQNILIKKGIDETLQKPEGSVDVEEYETLEEEFVDILSIIIVLDNAPQEENVIKLDVSFQRGNMISVIVPGANQFIVDYLDVGMSLEDVQFYSPAVIFTDSCVVSAKKQIESGPKKGDYTLLMKILRK